MKTPTETPSLQIQRPPQQFKTERLILRPVTLADAEAIFVGYSSSAAATKFMAWARHTQLAESVAFAERCVDSWTNGSAYPWAIVSRPSCEFIGVIELLGNLPNAELAFVLCERYWGQGFATEAARTVVDWVLAQPGIHRVWATCHPDNAASARVLVKAGLTFEATVEREVARPQLGELSELSLVFAKTRQGRTARAIR